ncbi:MAG: thioredoxin family protein [Desulfobacter sp.]|nr:MAG: thioredoxin family protein [Desulfobacter sp.]
MDKAARQIIKDWQGTGNTVTILASDHPEQKTFTKFAEAWSALSTGLNWKTGATASELPGFALQPNIIYSALPMERELSPFLKGLETIAAQRPLPDAVRALLEQVRRPVRLTLYIALQCPHCPVMVDTLIPLAAACDMIHLHIIDGSLFTENARNDKVMSAPCLLLDNDFRWTGAVSETEILSMILNRDPSSLSTATLKNILEEGNADWITQEMIRAGKIFNGFAGLLLHDTWSVRLGAMVVVEALAEQAPDLGLTLAPVLMDEFETKEIPAQGDILYALGEIGNLETKAWIAQQLSRLEHEDLKDAAQDALDAIESRFSG